MQGIVFVDSFCAFCFCYLPILALLTIKLKLLPNDILYPPSSYYQDGKQDTGEEDEDEEKEKRRKKGGSFCQGNWVHSLLQKSESEN